MKTIFKVLLIVFAFLLVSILIYITPLSQKAPRELDNSVLLMNGFYGGEGGANDELYIYKNGSIYFKVGPGKYGRGVYTNLSNERMQEVNDFINQGNFNKRKESYYDKSRYLGCSDCGSSILLINKNGKTINIEWNNNILELNRKILEESRVYEKIREMYSNKTD